MGSSEGFFFKRLFLCSTLYPLPFLFAKSMQKARAGDTIYVLYLNTDGYMNNSTMEGQTKAGNYREIMKCFT
jgi:hypothetical protein